MPLPIGRDAEKIREKFRGHFLYNILYNKTEMIAVDKINLSQKLSLFSQYWSPKIVGELSDSYIKLAKLKGEFDWHHHDNPLCQNSCRTGT